MLEQWYLNGKMLDSSLVGPIGKQVAGGDGSECRNRKWRGEIYKWRCPSGVALFDLARLEVALLCGRWMSPFFEFM